MTKAFSIIFLIACATLFACSSVKKAKTKEPTASRYITTPEKLKMYDDNTFQLTGISDDPTYGYNEKNAINVGGGATPGPDNEKWYLNALMGPAGESISYNRLGSCCPVSSKNGFMGQVMLDIFEIQCSWLDKSVKIYINMYDPGTMKAPKGFTFKK
jgi:hypothetical protein